MIIKEIAPLEGSVLRVVAEDGRVGTVDISCYLNSPAFSPLKDKEEFAQIRNGKYFVEWVCGADLSADTLEARMTWTAGEDAKLMVAEDSGKYKAQ